MFPADRMQRDSLCDTPFCSTTHPFATRHDGQNTFAGRCHRHPCNALVIKYHSFSAWITYDFLINNPRLIP